MGNSPYQVSKLSNKSNISFLPINLNSNQNWKLTPKKIENVENLSQH